MTGFGTSVTETTTATVHVEVRTLNSKFLDLSLRLPRAFAERELLVRDLVARQLERGKAMLTVEVQHKNGERPKVRINRALVKAYYDDLRATAEAVGASTESLLTYALQMPDATYAPPEEEGSEIAWETVLEGIAQALRACQQFRHDEGQTLARKLAENVGVIRDGLARVIQLDPGRIEAQRERLRERLRSLLTDQSLDENRFEQELIYYLEKFSIEEERVRLRAHLDYFEEAAAATENSGKKLNFIAQEIGREINTIGSKANDAPMQRVVVEMKDELDKIKEQVMNVL